MKELIGTLPEKDEVRNQRNLICSSTSVKVMHETPFFSVRETRLSNRIEVSSFYLHILLWTLTFIDRLFLWENNILLDRK